MVTKTKGLPIPKSSFQKQALSVVTVEPNRIIRVSTNHTGEPYFGQSGANRFDDPNPIHVARCGTCYFGYNLKTAIAETLLHDISPVNGHFLINPDRIAALGGTNKIDGFSRQTRRTSQRYRVYREDLQRRMARKDTILCSSKSATLH